MPIRGMTDQDSVTPRFPRLGKLRKGGERVEKTKDGRKYTVMGPDLDYFRFTSDRPEIVEAFYEAYGEKPTSILVYLPYISPDENFPTWCELWNESGMIHRCDGENMVIWLEGSKYVRGSKSCPGGHKDGDARNDCIGRLALIIPELVTAGFAGYVTMETHSKNDIVGITNVLADVFNMRKDNEMGLRGITFNLKRIKENISVPGWGDRKDKRSRTDKYLVKIEPVIEWVKLQLDYDRRAAMALPAGDAQDRPVEATEDEIGDTRADEDIPDGSYTEEPPADDDVPPEFAGDPVPTVPALAACWPKGDGVPSYQLASTIKDKTSGRLYLDIPDGELKTIADGIMDALDKNHLPEERRIDLELKYATALAIPHARAAQAAQPAMI